MAKKRFLELVTHEDVSGDNGDDKMNDRESEYVSKELLDAKLETLNTKIDSGLDRINDKLDNMPVLIQNELLKEREYQDTKQKEKRRFIWGTIIIGGLSALAGIVSAIISIIN